MQGFPFLKGESRRLTVTSLASKMLCERHNHALSPLDSEALKAFKALRRFEANYRDSRGNPDFDAVLVSGPMLEAWLLKTGFGFLASGLLRLEGAPAAGWRGDADKLLLRCLFGEGAMPQDWGMWLVPPRRPKGAAADIAVEHAGKASEVWSFAVEFGAFTFTLALGTPGGHATFHPGAIVLLKSGSPSAQQTLLLGWPDGRGGGPVIATRVGQLDDWDSHR